MIRPLFLLFIQLTWLAAAYGAPPVITTPPEKLCAASYTAIDLKFEKTPYRWVTAKAAGRGEGNYVLDFPEAEKISNLDPAIQGLQGTLDILRTPLKGVGVYHETTYAGGLGFVDGIPQSGPLSGTINSSRLKLTNGQTEAAFYTHIDEASGVMLGRPRELLAKIEVTDPDKRILAVLREPDSEPEMAKILTTITGDPTYFDTAIKNWEKLHPGADDGTRFDVFHDTVVRALREKHGISIDAMLFEKRFIGDGPVKAEYLYTWMIFYNRDTLNRANVPHVFSLAAPNAKQFSKADGVDESGMIPLTREVLELFKTKPKLHDVVFRNAASRVNYLPYDAATMKVVFGNQSITDPMRREWYSGLDSQFERKLLGSGKGSLLELLKTTGEDSKALEDQIVRNAAEFWAGKTKFKTQN